MAVWNVDFEENLRYVKKETSTEGGRVNLATDTPFAKAVRVILKELEVLLIAKNISSDSFLDKKCKSGKTYQYRVNAKDKDTLY